MFISVFNRDNNKNRDWGRNVDSFDYVIVGGGTAASIIAYRLSEKGHSVCVLEAGPPDSNPYIRVPAGFIKTLFDPRVTWQYSYEPSPATNNRSIQVTQGKTLGGSSSVNGMVYNRGQAQDFDGWAALGNPGWAYDDILPCFRRTEHRIGPGDDRYRGRSGPLTVTTAPWPSKLVSAFVEGAQQQGHPFNEDYNGPVQEGVGYYQSAVPPAPFCDPPSKPARWMCAPTARQPGLCWRAARQLVLSIFARVATKHCRCGRGGR